MVFAIDGDDEHVIWSPFLRRLLCTLGYSQNDFQNPIIKREMALILRHLQSVSIEAFIHWAYYTNQTPEVSAGTATDRFRDGGLWPVMWCYWLPGDQWWIGWESRS